MKLAGSPAVCLWGGLLLLTTAGLQADDKGGFKVIVDRNPFGLRPVPPPPPPVKDEPVKPPSSYKLSGITSLFNPPKVLLVSQPAGATRPEYLSLAEGEKQGEVEILEGGINVDEGKVQVRIAGALRTLSFESDGIRSVGGPLATTGMPGASPVPQPLSPNINLGIPAPLGGAAPPVNFQVTPRSALPTGGAPLGAGMVEAATPGLRASPSRPLRLSMGGETPTYTQPAPPPNIEPAVQAVLMEANRMVDQPKVDAGQAPPLPPTDLTGR